MTAPRAKLGSRAWQKAVSDARDLGRAEKALLFAFLTYLDWETGEAVVSMDRLAGDIGWGVRALQSAAARLRERGVLVYPDGWRGGRRADGRGIANRIRLDLAVLEALKGARGAPLKGASGGELGCTARRARVHPTTEKGAPGAPKQLRQQPQRTTTTATTGAGADREPGDAGGGGGGGDAASSGGGDVGDADAALQPAPHDPGESRRMLLEFGLTVGKADKLAPLHAPEVVRTGIDWVRRNGDGARSQQGLLVKILSDGTALEEWRSAERRRRRAEQERIARERHKERCRRLERAFSALLGHEDEATRAEARGRLQVVWTVWRGVENLAVSEAVPDAMLFAETLDATGVVDVAFETAQRLLARRAAS